MITLFAPLLLMFGLISIMVVPNVILRVMDIRRERRDGDA